VVGLRKNFPWPPGTYPRPENLMCGALKRKLLTS